MLINSELSYKNALFSEGPLEQDGGKKYYYESGDKLLNVEENTFRLYPGGEEYILLRKLPQNQGNY
jgi:hypothetical protein